MNNDLIKTIVTTIASIGAFTAVVRFGIEKYFQKNEEVLKLKEQITNNAIKSLEITMDKVGHDLAEVNRAMADLEGSLIIFQSRLNDYDARFNATINHYYELSQEIKHKLEIMSEHLKSK